VQSRCLSSITALGRYSKQKAWVSSVDESLYESIRPETEIDEKAIATIQSKRERKRSVAKEKAAKLVCVLFYVANSRFWRLRKLLGRDNGDWQLMSPDSSAPS
jgi:hypothetical protein